MQVFAFLETSHLFNGFYSWPLTTIEVDRWQENVGKVTLSIARNGHIALLEHLDQSLDFKFKTKFRTPAAVSYAFQGAAEGGHLVILKWLREKNSWEFGQDRSWFSHLMCKTAAESGSMELCMWMKDAGLLWDWRWVHAAAPDSLVGGH